MSKHFNRSHLSSVAGALAVGCAATMSTASVAQVLVRPLAPLVENVAPETQSIPAGVPALDGQVFEGAEWEDGFDSGVRSVREIDTVSPIISLHTQLYMEQAIPRYRQIVANGGWNMVSYPGKPLRIGKQHDSVVELRQRLIISGDLDAGAGLSKIFDSYVDTAVRRFQLRHGLLADGIVGKGTIEALNVPAIVRLRQLEINMGRVAELADQLNDTYVMVNVPAARIEAVEAGRVRSRHTAVVGKIDRQTPILNSKITEVNFNPYWTVPVSIIRKDLIPKMQEDPSYLEKNKIKIFDWYGNQKQWQDIDWNTQEATQYRFTQDPGEKNSMGSIRINFHNKFQVYLHDTPEQSLFGSGYRFHSSGCVRVQNVRELVSWLLGATTPGWDRAKVDESIRGGERLDAKLKTRIPIFLSYVTAWASSDGAVHFRDDIYKMDGLSDSLPILSEAVSR
ncbi:L,D-transpeptidase family protein [Flexibacterium corallicola]|uniref:L,D-transpeptidase family protein n=1 Tax=Flexibacterium corallicola TaxID=3037259 RepID=UPI00286F6478|nr:L,D-transpeptidase family protein [Pseudovibrio sp. M1P-2-3]